MVSGIYIITHTESFRRYVGQSKNIPMRLKTHWRKLSQNKHDNIYLQRAYNKYGRDAFTVSTIECVEDLLTPIEQSMLSQWGNLYNICKIVNVPPNSKGNKRGPRSATWKANISAGMQGKAPWNRGIPHTAEARALMSKSSRGPAWQYMDEIKALRATGLSNGKIARKYNCHPGTIRLICLS